MRCPAALLPLLALATLAAAPEYPARGPDIYDPAADGAVQIDAALAAARTAHQRVLLDFGANWCPWCHRLHHLFTTEAEVRRRLDAGYVLVLVDVNRRHGPARNAAVNERYGDPIRLGLPVLVVLDDAGRVLATQDTGQLEAGEAGGGVDGYRPEKVIAFLDQWAPPARP